MWPLKWDCEGSWGCVCGKLLPLNSLVVDRRGSAGPKLGRRAKCGVEDSEDNGTCQAPLKTLLLPLQSCSSSSFGNSNPEPRGRGILGNVASLTTLTIANPALKEAGFSSGKREK